MTATDATDGFFGIRKYVVIPINNNTGTTKYQIGVFFSSLAETSESFVSGSP
jgi:hypothetical protein